jgi:hypothetical protein
MISITFTYRDEDLGREYTFEIEGKVGRQHAGEPVDVQWTVERCLGVRMTLPYSDAAPLVEMGVPRDSDGPLCSWFNACMGDEMRDQIVEDLFAAHNRLLAGGVGPQNCQEDVTA